MSPKSTKHKMEAKSKGQNEAKVFIILKNNHVGVTEEARRTEGGSQIVNI